MSDRQRLRDLGFRVTHEIHTAGDPYNAYSLYWYTEAWRDDELVATAEAEELTDAFILLLQRVAHD